MTRFSQQELPYPDPRSEKELAQAILDFVLIPKTDSTNLKGPTLSKPAKTLASISLDGGSPVIREFRHGLFELSRGEYNGKVRRGIEAALFALDELAGIYDQKAATARHQAGIEFIDTPTGLSARLNTDIAEDINNAENYTIIAGRLRTDMDLRNLIQALAKKLSITLSTGERGV